MKICTVCKNEKPLTAFYVSRTKGTGRQSRCKACNGAEYQRQKMMKNKRGPKEEGSVFVGVWKRVMVRPEYGI